MSAVLFFLEALSLLVILDAILSWVIRSPHRFPRSLTSRITDPLYRPIRRVLRPEKTGGLDLSPIVVLVGIQILTGLLARLSPT